MKIAVLTSRYPYPLEKGDKLRIYHHIRVLAQSHEVVLISIAENEDYQKYSDQLKPFVQSQHVFVLSKFERILSLIKAVFTKGSFRSAYFFSSRIKNKITQVLSNESPAHIHCHLIRMAPFVSKGKASMSLDYMDCFSAEAKKRMKASKGIKRYFFRKEYARTLKDEHREFLKFEDHFVISDQDRRLLNVKDQEQIQILPNGIDLDFFKPNTQSSPKFEVGFMGNLGYYSNIDAIKFLKENIIPQLGKHSLLIAGARPPSWVKELAHLDQVEVKSWVEDIRDAYWDIKVFVAPLFKGVGMQNKILEAMACGIPVVTTNQVNNAIGAVDNEEIVLANSPEEFLRSINRLLDDPMLYQKISANALKKVQSNFSWESQTKVLIDSIGKSKKPKH